MREILYRKKESEKKHRKMISINEHTEDGECKTHIRKGFVYIVRKVEQIDKKVAKPEIYIVKSIDSKTRVEKFCFRVKGSFYLTKDRSIVQVDFYHTLRICLYWKNKIFSPKKSVTLT